MSLLPGKYPEIRQNPEVSGNPVFFKENPGT